MLVDIEFHSKDKPTELQIWVKAYLNEIGKHQRLAIPRKAMHCEGDASSVAIDEMQAQLHRPQRRM